MDGACEECGSGTPMPGETARWVEEATGVELTPWQRSLLEQDPMPLPREIAVRLRPTENAYLPKPTWWQRFARWPH